MGDAPEDPERIGWIWGGLAGGNSVDLYEGDSKDSYLQPDDRQSIHTSMGRKYAMGQKEQGPGAHVERIYRKGEQERKDRIHNDMPEGPEGLRLTRVIVITKAP